MSLPELLCKADAVGAGGIPSNLIEDWVKSRSRYFGCEVYFLSSFRIA